MADLAFVFHCRARIPPVFRQKMDSDSGGNARFSDALFLGLEAKRPEAKNLDHCWHHTVGLSLHSTQLWRIRVLRLRCRFRRFLWRDETCCFDFADFGGEREPCHVDPPRAAPALGFNFFPDRCSWGDEYPACQ